MGLFGFSARKERLNWDHITTVEALESAYSNSSERAQLFFKHSTRCPVSAMALNAFESNWKTEEAEIHFIDLLSYRDVSQRLAEISGVRHESPQVIVVKNGEVIYADSHDSINASRIETKLKR